MTKEQLVAKFNPSNAGNLSPEDLDVMHKLTDADLDILAEAYPNTPARRAYLVLYDNNIAENKQIYQLSTWQNLRNVRKFSNKKNLIPWNYRANVQPTARAGSNGNQIRKPAPGTRVAVDLSAQEAADQLTEGLGKKSELGTGVTTQQNADGAKATTRSTARKPATEKKSTTATKDGAAKAIAPAPVETPNVETPADQEFTSGGTDTDGDTKQ